MKIKVIAGLFAVFFIVGGSTQIYAAEMEEIVVVAQKTEESIQDVPLAISAFSGDQLIKMGVKDLTELDRFTPSLTVARTQGANTGLIVGLRGQVASDILLTIDPAVGTYIDGVNIPHGQGMAGAFFDLDRVEVLKGPQGTLYGKNTTGGAVNLIANKPDFSGYSAMIGLDAGNYNKLNADLVLNAPLIEDVLAVRLAVNSSQRDGWANQSNRTITGDPVMFPSGAVVTPTVTTGNRDLSDDNELNVRFGLAYNPTDNFRVAFSADSTQVRESAPGESLLGWIPGDSGGVAAIQAAVELGLMTPTQVGKLFTGGCTVPDLDCFDIFTAIGAADTFMLDNVANFDIYKTDTNTRPTSQFDGWGTKLELAVDVDGFTFTSITAYRSIDAERQIDLAGTPFTITIPDLSTDAKTFSQELNLSTTRMDGRLNWISGIFYHRETGSDGSTSAAIPAVNPLNPNFFDADVLNSSWAFYTQFGYDLSQALHLTAGVRYTEEDKQLDSRNSNGNLFVPGTFTCNTPNFAGDVVTDRKQCEQTFLSSAEGVSWLLSLDYRLNDQVLVYGKVARSFHSGGHNLRGNTAATFTPADPEFVLEYELGLKGDFLDDRVRANLAAYLSDYTDQIVSTIVQTPTGAQTVITNAAESTIYGFEADITAYPFDALRLTLSTSYINATYDKYVNNVLDEDRVSVSTDLSGDNLALGARPWKANFGARYEREVGFGILGLQADYSWSQEAEETGREYNAYPAEVYKRFYEARTLLNARIDYDIPKYNLYIAIYATNLTDEEYVIPSADVTLSYISGIAEEPMLWGVQFTKTFN